MFDLQYHYLAFQVKVLEASGNEFQSLFFDIMERAYPSDFQSIRAYGNQGDWKCDGRMNGQYFQCYRPDQMKAPETLSKVKEDFGGCIERWGAKVLEWTFVHNAKDGLPPQVRAGMDELATANSCVALSDWGRSKLWNLASSLSLERRSEVLGGVPGREEVQNVSFAELKVILDYLSDRSASVTPPDIPADPHEKVLFNQLSTHAEDLLRIGIPGSVVVEDYIGRHPNPMVGENLRKRFVQEFESLKVKHPHEPDVLFGLLLDFASVGSQDVRIRGAGLAVLTYFFVACDIFEVPTLS